ncbi:MAG: hypothetical protein AB7K09_14955 [Planctomycetota bacterium]
MPSTLPARLLTAVLAMLLLLPAATAPADDDDDPAPVVLTVGEPHNGVIGDGEGDDYMVKQHFTVTLTAEQAEGRTLEFGLTALGGGDNRFTNVDPIFVVTAPDGQIWYSNADNSGAVAWTVRRRIPGIAALALPGEWTLRMWCVNKPRTPWTYTLLARTIETTGRDTAAAPVRLTSGVTTSGSLEPGDTRADPRGEPQYYIDWYEFEVPAAGGQLSIVATSPVYLVRLIVVGPDGSRLPDVAAAPERNSAVQALTAVAGVYRIAVRSGNSRWRGAYTVVATLTVVNGKPTSDSPLALKPDEPATGTLEFGDSGYQPDREHGLWIDWYELTVPAGQRLVARLTASTFIPLLVLVPPDGGAPTRAVGERDITGAFVEVPSVAGVWRIGACTYQANHGGKYELTAVFDALGTPTADSPVAVVRGATVHGSHVLGDSIRTEDRSEYFVDWYQLDATAGEKLTIRTSFRGHMLGRVIVVAPDGSQTVHGQREFSLTAVEGTYRLGVTLDLARESRKYAPMTSRWDYDLTVASADK